MQRRIAGKSPCARGALRAGWCTGALLFVALSVPWRAHAQKRGASPSEDDAGRRASGWATLVLALAVLVGLRRRPCSGFTTTATIVLTAAILTACGPRRRPDRPTVPFSDEVVTGRASDWTIGPSRAPPSHGRARLLWRTTNQPLERAHPVTTCEECANLILPAPDGSRVYLAVKGTIVFIMCLDDRIVSGHERETQPTPRAMSSPEVHVRRRLAFVRERQPPVILVQVEEGVTACETLWLFRIHGRTAMGEASRMPPLRPAEVRLQRGVNLLQHGLGRARRGSPRQPPTSRTSLTELCEKQDLMLQARGDGSERSQQSQLGRALQARETESSETCWYSS